MFFSATMLVPVAVSLYYRDGEYLTFGLGFLIVLVSGASIWFPARNNRRDLRIRDGFLIRCVSSGRLSLPLRAYSERWRPHPGASWQPAHCSS